MVQSCPMTGPIASSVAVGIFLKSDKLNAETKKRVSEADANDQQTLGQLTQNEINRAAIMIRKDQPSQFDAFLTVLAEQSACVTIPVDDYINASKAGEQKQPLDEKSLPLIDSTIFLSTADRGLRPGERERIKVMVKPEAQGVTSQGFCSTSHGLTRFVISILYRFKGDDGFCSGQHLYVSGAGERDVKFEEFCQYTDESHFSAAEARKMVGFLDRAIISVRAAQGLADLMSRLVQVKDYLNYRLEQK